MAMDTDPTVQYPRWMHSENLDPATGELEASIIVQDPEDEKERAPANEGWHALRRDAVDAAAKKAKDLKKKRPAVVAGVAS
jgi:hypothetical protein